SRDIALRDIIEVQMLSKKYFDDHSCVISALNKISFEENVENAILFILTEIEKGNGSFSPESNIERLIGTWNRINHPHRRIKGLVLAFVVGKRLNLAANLVDSFDENSQKIWDELPGDFAKVELGYWVVKKVASVDASLSLEWFEKVKFESESIPISSSSLVRTIEITSRLAIRSFSGLIQTKSITPEESN